MDFLECFEHFDRDFSGEIEDREFQDGLRRIGIDLTHDEARSMMDRFPSCQRGGISYRAFVKGLRLRAPDDRDTAEVERVLKDELRRHAETPRRLQLQQPVRRVRPRRQREHRPARVQEGARPAAPQPEQ